MGAYWLFVFKVYVFTYLVYIHTTVISHSHAHARHIFDYRFVLLDLGSVTSNWLIRVLQRVATSNYYNNGHAMAPLTHWGRVTHICVGKLTIIGSDNGLSPGRDQTIVWTNAGILLIGPLGTNFSEILIAIQTFSLKKMHLKMSSGKCRPFCLGLNVLSSPTNHLNCTSVNTVFFQFLTTYARGRSNICYLSLPHGAVDRHFVSLTFCIVGCGHWTHNIPIQAWCPRPRHCNARTTIIRLNAQGTQCVNCSILNCALARTLKNMSTRGRDDAIWFAGMLELCSRCGDRSHSLPIQASTKYWH